MTGPVSRIPAVVPLLPGAQHYRADSRLSVRQLAADLLEVHPMGRAAIAATLLDKGMMLPREWWARLAVQIAVWRGARRYDFWMMFFAKHHAAATELVERTALHIVEGHDRDDASSVGGFSQAEVNVLSNLLAIMSGEYGSAMDAIAESNEVN